MTKFEFDICLKVLKQFYITDEIGSIIRPVYDDKSKNVSIDWWFPIDLDKKLDKNYNIRKDYGSDYVRYVIKDFRSFLYFFQHIRNTVSHLIELNKIDALEYMIESAEKHIIKKEVFNVSNELWLNKIGSHNNVLDINIKDLLNRFDESINPFLNNDLEIGNIYDVDMYTENGIDNCTHFTIRDKNIVKQYNRHSNGFLYSKKIIDEDYVLYVGHYFNFSKNGEVVSIIYNSDNDEIKLKYNLDDHNVMINNEIAPLSEDSLKLLFEYVNLSIEENKYTKKH